MEMFVYIIEREISESGSTIVKRIVAGSFDIACQIVSKLSGSDDKISIYRAKVFNEIV